MKKKSPGANKRKLRSTIWFGRHDRDALVHRSWMKNQGFPHDLFDGRPVIGICNTWSEVTPCNAHFRELAEHVRAGVLEAGGSLSRPDVDGEVELSGRDECVAVHAKRSHPAARAQTAVDTKETARERRTARTTSSG